MAADSVRFPERNVAWMERRLGRLLSEVRPTGIVSAAAAGADLLMLAAAQSLGLHTEILLPLPVDEFRARSVADRGSDWLERFDRVTRDRAAVTIHDLSRHDDWYLRGNGAILDHAQHVASDEGLLAVAVRPPPDPTNPSATDDFVRRARRRGVTAIDLDPSHRRQPTAAVMTTAGHDRATPGLPLGTDDVFRTIVVPLLEDADFDWRRTDDASFGSVADLVVLIATSDDSRMLDECARRGRPMLVVTPSRQSGGISVQLLGDACLEIPAGQMSDATVLCAIATGAPAVATVRSRVVLLDDR